MSTIDDPELGVTPEAIAALRAHPAFPAAMRHVATCLIEHYKGNRVLNALINDRGRMHMGFLALYLHYAHRPGDPNTGLTVSRLKSICVEQKYCSGGRAEAMISLMRLFGYVAPAENPWDRRLRLLVPTDKLIATHLERWVFQFTAMAMVMEEGRLALEGLKRPEFTPAMIRQLSESHFAGRRLLDYAPGLELFTDRNSGTMVMFSLLIGGGPGDTMPPQRPFPVSISGLAKRFGVSRAHVRKLFADAMAEGFLARSDNPDEVLLTPRFGETVCDFFAALFLTLAGCAMAALAEIGEARAAA